MEELALDLKRKAIEVFRMERGIGASEYAAMAAAVQAAVDAHSRQANDALADQLQDWSEETTDEVQSYTLAWAAERIRKQQPPAGDYDYTPAVGDRIELHWRGAVTDVQSRYWTFVPDEAEDPEQESVSFVNGIPDNLRVRLLHREEE